MDLSGELAKTLLDLAPDATVVVDAHGTIVFANAQIEQTFGYRAEELVGSSIEALLPDRFRAAHPGHRERFATQPRSRPMGAGLALYGRHKDGHEFPVEISLSPVTTSSGPLVVGAVRDATVAYDRQFQLVEENRQKSHFLAAASHDLRQPLQTLNLLNRAAQRMAGSNDALIGLLERQQLALDSMATLLASVLDISKLDSGAVEARPAACPVDDIFARLRSDFEPQAADKGIDLTIERSADTAFSDAELLRRLLANLVSNAIRYTQAGGVHVSCVARGNKLQIEVRDTGIGIPGDQVERVFEEFYQVDRGTQRPEGLGLGLSIVRRLANLLRCDIKLDSAVGKGTSFFVNVDQSVLQEGVMERPGQVESANTGCVLVIDDERAVADATCLLLELEGYEVSVASSEREALKRVSVRSPDLIVSDFHLRGGETGVGVVTSVRKHIGGTVPVVFVTGDTAKAALADSKIENAVLLNKPVRADDLIAAVRQAIAARREHPVN
jgi:PAS domain S-box-containing protein